MASVKLVGIMSRVGSVQIMGNIGFLLLKHVYNFQPFAAVAIGPDSGLMPARMWPDPGRLLPAPGEILAKSGQQLARIWQDVGNVLPSSTRNDDMNPKNLPRIWPAPSPDLARI